MAQLSFFTEEDVESIISLPFRAGMFVSYAEDEDGEQDDVREMQALEGCLKEIARVHEGEELTKEIAAAILNAKDKWPVWSQGVFNIEPLCEKAIVSLKTQAGKEEVKDYIKMTVEVATSVAQAYGEFGEGQDDEKGFFGKIVAAVTSVSVDDTAHPMNVSAAEDSAIATVAAALKRAA